MKVSEWQDGVPPCEGIWEIETVKPSSGIYFCRYKDNMWGVGYSLLEYSKYYRSNFGAYPNNNQPNNPVKWRGVIDE